MDAIRKRVATGAPVRPGRGSQCGQGFLSGVAGSSGWPVSSCCPTGRGSGTPGTSNPCPHLSPDFVGVLQEVLDSACDLTGAHYGGDCDPRRFRPAGPLFHLRPHSRATNRVGHARGSGNLRALPQDAGTAEIRRPRRPLPAYRRIRKPSWVRRSVIAASTLGTSFLPTS